MDALEAALRPAAKILNRNIQESTPAKELCEELSGTVIAVRVSDTALAAYFIVDDEAVDVVAATSQDPDVLISGSLIALAGLTGHFRLSQLRSPVKK